MILGEDLKVIATAVHMRLIGPRARGVGVLSSNPATAMGLRSFLRELSSRDASPQLSSTSASTALVPYTSLHASPPTSLPTSVHGSDHGSDQGSVRGSIQGSTLGSSAVSALELPFHPVRDGGVIVAVTRNPDAELLHHPKTHVFDLLNMLMDDRRYAGQWMTSLALEQCYAELCRLTRSKPLPWMAVVRQIYITLDGIYGSACYKGSKSEYVGSRTKRLRTCRIPTRGEVLAAQAARQNPDVVALHQHGLA